MPNSRIVLNNKLNRLHILEWPSPTTNAPKCLLLHGVANNAQTWEAIANHLSSTFHVYALDFRGHGNSDWDLDLDYTPDHFMQDLNYCISALSLSNFHLIGHSLGARIALLYLRSHKNCVRSVTIIDTSPKMKKEVFDKIKNDINQLLKVYNSPEAYIQNIKSMYFFSDESTLKKLSENDLLKINNNQWKLKFDQQVMTGLSQSILDSSEPLKTGHLDQTLDFIKVPCLIIRGQISSVLSKEQATRMNKEITGSQLVTIPKAGHTVTIDNPKETSRVLLSFLINN